MNARWYLLRNPWFGCETQNDVCSVLIDGSGSYAFSVQTVIWGRSVSLDIFIPSEDYDSPGERFPVCPLLNPVMYGYAGVFVS